MTSAVLFLEKPPQGVVVDRASPRLARVSLTDRCDLACLYCRASRNEAYLAAEERLDVAAWERMTRGLLRAGVTRVRITGGEPLLRADLVEIVARMRALGVEDLALTTNGTRLAELAAPLRAAGLARINVSLPSLDAARFAEITRGGALGPVLEGIEAARIEGFPEVKTNTVVLRGLNDDALPELTRWAWERGIVPRFLELMGVGEGARLPRERFVSYSEQRVRLASLLAAGALQRDVDRGPARYISSRDGRHRVGFITGSSETFCAGCDRLRVSADGTLRPCLALEDGVGAGDVVRVGGDGCDAEVASRLAEAWQRKPDGRWRGCNEVTAGAVSMRASGG